MLFLLYRKQLQDTKATSVCTNRSQLQRCISMRDQVKDAITTALLKTTGRIESAFENLLCCFLPSLTERADNTEHGDNCLPQ